MCGRFSLFADDEELVSLFDVDLLLGEHRPSFNVAPSQQVRVVMDRLADDNGHTLRPTDVADSPNAHVQRQLRLLRWGLVPSWAKTPERPIINARAETLTTKPSFRSAAARRRCLVPANGYFEWQQPPSGAGRKQPWFLSAGGGGPTADADEGDPVLALAGIFEAWRIPSSSTDAGSHGDGTPSEWLLTCAIITRSAPDALGEIHERTPVVVPPRAWDAWLDPRTTSSEEVEQMLRSIPDPHLVPRRVSTAVGNVRNDSPELILPVGWHTPPGEPVG